MRISHPLRGVSRSAWILAAVFASSLLNGQVLYSAPQKRAATAKAAIQEQYDQLSQGIMTGNVSVYREICLPSAAFMEPGLPAKNVQQEQSDIHSVDGLVQGGHINSVTQTIKDLKLGAGAKTAETDIFLIVTGVIVDKRGLYGPKGKTQTWSYSQPVHDLWIKHGPAWRLRKSVMGHASQFRINGIVVPDAD